MTRKGKMKKILKVELNESRQQTEEHGRLYKSQNWDIPFDSTESGECKKTPLEAHMLQELGSAFPDEFYESAIRLLYSDLSAGGTLQIGEATLKVSFAIDHGHPSR